MALQYYKVVPSGVVRCGPSTVQLSRRQVSETYSEFFASLATQTSFSMENQNDINGIIGAFHISNSNTMKFATAMQQQNQRGGYDFNRLSQCSDVQCTLEKGQAYVQYIVMAALKYRTNKGDVKVIHLPYSDPISAPLSAKDLENLARQLPLHDSFRPIAGAINANVQLRNQSQIEGMCSKCKQIKSMLASKLVSSCDQQWVGNDAGSGADHDLDIYEYIDGDWFMLGHGWGGDMWVVQKGPMVMQATSWERIWKDEGSEKKKDYDIYIPQCNDPNFLALGVVCVFRGTSHPKPRAGMPVALVHKDLCEPASLDNFVWSDAGTGAKWDVTLDVTGMGTMWPTVATYVGSPPQCYEVKSECL